MAANWLGPSDSFSQKRVNRTDVADWQISLPFSAGSAASKKGSFSRSQYSIFLMTISPGKFIDHPLVEVPHGKRPRKGAGNEEKEAESELRIETEAENDDRAKNGGRCWC